MTRRGPLALLAAALLALVVVSGAGCGTASSPSSGALDVVATTSFLADIAQNVAGDRFQVQSLVPVGTDPHAFEPAPSDLKAVAGADLVIVNGGGLEGTLLTTLENAVGDTTIVDASAGLQSRTPKPGEPPLAEGEADPHFWLDPELVRTYVKNIEAAFSKADPAGAATYAANAAAYDKKLEALDGLDQAGGGPDPGGRPQAGHGPRQPGVLRRPLRVHHRRHRHPKRQHRRVTDRQAVDRPRGSDPRDRRQGDLRGVQREPATGRADRRRDRASGS